MPKASQKTRPQRLGIVACGALAREIELIIAANGLDNLTVRYLPAKLHNTPADIPAAVAGELEKLAPDCDQLLVAYGDCGTAGKLDVVLEQFGATRLKGADRKSTRLNSSHTDISRMPSSA